MAKLGLIREFQTAQGVADDDLWLQSLDLAYHHLDPDNGLYFGLEQTGTMRGIPSEEAVLLAASQPPETTRALIRGRCIQKFGPAVVSAQWDHVTLQGSRGLIRISLLDLFAPADVSRYRDAVEAAASPDELQLRLHLPSHA